jgi:hypothetical protein
MFDFYFSHLHPSRDKACRVGGRRSRRGITGTEGVRVEVKEQLTEAVLEIVLQGQPAYPGQPAGCGVEDNIYLVAAN